MAAIGDKFVKFISHGASVLMAPDGPVERLASRALVSIGKRTEAGLTEIIGQKRAHKGLVFLAGLAEAEPGAEIGVFRSGLIDILQTAASVNAHLDAAPEPTEEEASAPAP